MNLDQKDIISWLTWAISLGGLFEWIRNKFKTHNSRLKRIEKCLVNDEQEPRLMSYKAHDKICMRYQANIVDIKDHLIGVDRQQKKILVELTKVQTLISTFER